MTPRGNLFEVRGDRRSRVEKIQAGTDRGHEGILWCLPGPLRVAIMTSNGKTANDEDDAKRS